MTWPVSGCRLYSASISSPNISMRIACSSYTGMISIVSPRTRKLPREKSTSLRWYCIETNLRMSQSRSTRWPTCSGIIAFRYSSGVPRP